MEAGFVERALVLLQSGARGSSRRAGVLAAKLPSSGRTGEESWARRGRGRGRWKVSGAGRTAPKEATLGRRNVGFQHAQRGGAGPYRHLALAKRQKKGPSDRSAVVRPGEPRAAQIPWHEEQAEPSAACQWASTEGQRKRVVAADASEGWCGSAGFAPGDAATLWKQRPGPLKFQCGKHRGHAGGEPTRDLHLQGTRVTVMERGDPWCDEECVLDFDEDSVEEGELVDDREEEDWWAQGGAGPLMRCLSHFRG
ncbi:hypothetical protein NDU88_007632 [Pleurodeles waltl]|uniref:Uncharacterized protein n=1 Tax=Pleurodeles waltl TaxID=8319 RepID=A0AAV7RQ09_PLEWA|nr:hypothetical protein NDU88_007632 [Pleurodeles waltl]